MGIKRCPQCGGYEIQKSKLDTYWCWDCEQAWLIHRLSTYKTFEEASDTSHLLTSAHNQNQADEQFIIPPILRIANDTEKKDK